MSCVRIGDSASDSDPTHESNSTASDATCESVPAFDSNSDVGVVPIAIGDAVYETMDTAGEWVMSFAKGDMFLLILSVQYPFEHSTYS